MMWGYNAAWDWPMMLFMSAISLVCLTLIGLAIWALVRWLVRQPSTPVQQHAPSALETLRERYARGEIDTSTYLQMRDQLESTKQSADERLHVGL